MSNVPTPVTQQQPVATRPISGVATLIESDKFKTRLTSVLPSDITPERFVGVAQTALALKPELAECNPASVASSCIQLAQVGLIPDGRLANLVPFNQKNQQTGHWEKHCRLMMDYKGWIQILWKSKNFLKLHPDIVYTNDDFIENCGVIEKHVKNYQDRGEPYLAYFDVITKDQIHMSTVLHQSEIEDIRNKYSRDWQKPNSPWQKRPLEMWKKTAVNQAIKGLPYLFSISDKVADLQEADVETIDFRSQPETPAAPAEPQFQEMKPATTIPEASPVQEQPPAADLPPVQEQPVQEEPPAQEQPQAQEQAPPPVEEAPPVVEAEIVEEAPAQEAPKPAEVVQEAPVQETPPQPEADAFGKPQPEQQQAPAPAPAPEQQPAPSPQPTSNRNPFAEFSQS